MTIDEFRVFAVDYMFSFVGVPYKFGGDNSAGFDCSGLACEMLKCVGLIDRGADYTAHSLYYIFEDKKVKEPTEGCLIFFGNPKLKIHHVEIAVSDELSLGASGGGSHVLTTEDAIKHNAFVKVRSILKNRNKPCAYIDPFKL